MKKLLFTLAMLWSFAYGQVCADTDTARSNAVSMITYNSARITATVSHFGGSPTSLQLRYVRVGHTDTATASSVPTTALRNLTGLSASTQYVYYYKTICGSGSQSQTIGPYKFTTLSATITYTDERPTRFNYIKVDSNLIVPYVDTSIYRAASGPSIAYKSSNNTFYGYYPSCTCWRPLAIDSAGIIALLDDKVDSVTVSGDSLFYWKNHGVSYGYILPALNNVWKLTGNSSIDTSVNWLGTNDAHDLRFNVNGGRKFTMNTAGAFGIGAPADYGTSGYVLQSEGSGASPAWVNYTLQKALTAGSTLTINNEIFGTGVTLDFTDFVTFGAGADDIAFNAVNELAVTSDTITLSPTSGKIFVNNLTNLSTQNRLIGQYGTGSQVGYVTLSGLTLSSGVLTNPITASSTTTFTNKRWTARVGSTTSSATPTINTDNYDIYKLTAQTNDITSFTSNLSGTPVDGDILEIQITGTAARAITWGASFVSTTVTLPTTTTTTTTLTVVFQYYTTSSYGNNKWHCVNYY